MKTEYEYESECICKTECKGFVNVKCKLKKNKITAVEYLIKEFSKGLDINFNRRTNHIIEQAKEMEKQQIVEHHTWLLSGVMGEESAREDAKQYYNETYKNK